MKTPYVIAEAGVNFYDTAKTRGVTPLEEAMFYVDEAKRAGINAIKFQTYKAGKIASKNSPSYWDLTKEPTTSQYQLFQKFDSLAHGRLGNTQFLRCSGKLLTARDRAKDAIEFDIIDHRLYIYLCGKSEKFFMRLE